MALPMTDQELTAFRKAVNDLTGIQLDGSKKYLLETDFANAMGELDGNGTHRN